VFAIKPGAWGIGVPAISVIIGPCFAEPHRRRYNVFWWCGTYKLVLGYVLSNLGQDTVFGDVRIRYGEVFDELVELFWGYSVLMSIVDL
tara:strand:- start:24 stop:290 length:267 start_codon:yes stop_codon:yes gene_type:complete